MHKFIMSLYHGKAMDYMASHYYDLNKEELKDICLELLYQLNQEQLDKVAYNLINRD